MDAKLSELQAQQAQRAREWEAEEEARAIKAQVRPGQAEGRGPECRCYGRRECPY